MHFSDQITLGSIVQSIILCIAAIGVYWKHEARIASLERSMNEHLEISKPLIKLLADLDVTMKLMTMQLKDYPLHRHVKGQIIYPYKTEGRDE